VAFVGLLVGCQDKTGTNSDKSLAASKPAGGDPNAINAPIAPEAYKVTLALYGTPSLAFHGTSARYQVQVKNEGTVPVYGAGKNAVNLGVTILSSDGTIDGPGGLRDFLRVPLPLLAPGQSASVALSIPADAKVDGKTVRLATVQEFAAWHDTRDTIDRGPFHVVDGKFTEAPVTR